MFKNGFKYFIRNVFFKKERALAFCLIITMLSLTIEVIFNISGLFSASGAIYTIAGLFLNIKLTAHFHLTLPNGEPLGAALKYAMIEGEAILGGEESLEEKEKKIKEVEDDEIWGAFLMVAGTLIWGYGSYLMNLVQPLFH